MKKGLNPRCLSVPTPPVHSLLCAAKGNASRLMNTHTDRTGEAISILTALQAFRVESVIRSHADKSRCDISGRRKLAACQ